MSVILLNCSESRTQFIDNNTLDICDIKSNDYSNKDKTFKLGNTQFRLIKEGGAKISTFYLQVSDMKFELGEEMRWFSDDWDSTPYMQKIDNILNIQNTGYSTFIVSLDEIECTTITTSSKMVYENDFVILVFDKRKNLIAVANTFSSDIKLIWCNDAKFATLCKFKDIDEVRLHVIRTF